MAFRSSSSVATSRYASFSPTPLLRKSRYRSSRCCASSSVRSDSASGVRRSDSIRLRMRLFQSGMLDPRHSADCSNEVLPALALRNEYLAACRREAVVAPPALFGLLHPAPRYQPALLQPVQQRIEGGHVE